MWSFSGGVTLKCCSSKYFFYQSKKEAINIKLVIQQFLCQKNPHFMLYQSKGPKLQYTVEPQSYGLHSYRILGQPDTDIEYIFGKYHQNFYKMGMGHQV